MVVVLPPAEPRRSRPPRAVAAARKCIAQPVAGMGSVGLVTPSCCSERRHPEAVAQAHKNPAHEAEAFGCGENHDEVLLATATPQALRLADGHEAVTISENIPKGVLVFSFKNLGQQEAAGMNEQCPSEHFDSPCQKQKGLTGGARVDAALQPPAPAILNEWADWYCE